MIHRLRALFKRGETQFQPLDMNELVHEVLGIVHGELVTRSVEVAPELARGLPAVRGRPGRAQQVMLNLVINACDAMAAGSRPSSAACRSAPARRGDGAVQISFTDCGPGFTPEQYEQAVRAVLHHQAAGPRPRAFDLARDHPRPPRPPVGQPRPGKGRRFHMVLPALTAKG